MNIEQIKLVEDFLREFGEAHAPFYGHLFDLAELGVSGVAVAVTVSMAVIALLEVELADLDALQIQLVLALVL